MHILEWKNENINERNHFHLIFKRVECNTKEDYGVQYKILFTLFLPPNHWVHSQTLMFILFILLFKLEHLQTPELH